MIFANVVTPLNALRSLCVATIACISFAASGESRPIGTEGVCYLVKSAGDGNDAGIRVLVAESQSNIGNTAGSATNPMSKDKGSSLFLISSVSRAISEVRIRNSLLPDARFQYALALTNSLFAVAGERSGQSTVALVDFKGNVTASKVLPGDLNVNGMTRLSAEEFLLYGHRAGNPVLLRLNRSLDVRQDLSLKREGKFAEVIKVAIDMTASGLGILMRAVNLESLQDARLVLVRTDLNGRTLKENQIAGVIGDVATSNGSFAVAALELAPGAAAVVGISLFKDQQQATWSRKIDKLKVGMPAIGIAFGKNGAIFALTGDQFSAQVSEFSPDGVAREPNSIFRNERLKSAYFLLASSFGTLALAQQVRSSNGGPAMKYCPTVIPLWF